MLSGTACDGEVLALDCSGYQNTIHILHARYQIGSFPFSCGQRHNYSSSTSCPAFNATGEIVSKCQDYKKCLITVNESSFPGQSCARVRRQLEVFYQCISTNVKSKMSFVSLQSLLSTCNIMLKSHMFELHKVEAVVCYFGSIEKRPEKFRLEWNLNHGLCNTSAPPV